MPEGDSVYRAAARLREALAGRVLTRSDLRVPRFATADLTGRTTLDVVPRGKHLLIRLGPAAGPDAPTREPDTPLTLHTHLRMDGAWRVFPAAATGPAGPAAGRPTRPTRPAGPAHEIRVILATADHTVVGYRLPVVELIRTAEEHLAVGHLGPDLLGPDWDAEAAAANLLAAPGRPLGEALLDQRNLAGIGNIYKAELCFLAGLTPWTPVGDIPPATLPRIAAAAHRLLDANKDRRRNTTGSRRPGQELFVYGRAHRPCPRCGTPVREAAQDGRPTYWCPRCQSGPTP
ncbi:MULTISPECIES: DNA-formamidopyrimidine glycosylase family protein [unclassified Streptomyces]|uniref:DNA-formamidopyrimidine glycosylase family protein n=1 Tax=unclassified Streptomyces TaxID=2593676 RepID=UPI000DC7971A|nr:MULTISPECIES: DNA-formamidopyrimidine glycosylase family protein [unclassified Streptomyces]AWZ08522.1 DNA glycosylase [Streptomyces sp. ICC4]AWZ16312.1 DNA glycosylase [Streptomyces sp. ICC1]